MNERSLISALLTAAGTGTNRLRLAVACGILASLAAIALLGTSGWFLTSAAIAGTGGAAAVQAFNYLIPSAGIRLLAIVRTAARYGERLLGHQAALQAMASLRTGLFSRRAAEDSRASPSDARTASAILLDDIAALEDIVMRRPAWFAGLAGCAVSIALVSTVGWVAAIGQTVMLALVPLMVRWLAAQHTANPAAETTALAIEIRAEFTEFAASRSEINAYGLSGQVVDELRPLWQRYEASKQKLLNGEALIAGVLGMHMALAVGLVLVLGHGSAPLMAMAFLASGAGVEAMKGFVQSSLRQAGIDGSLSRLSDLSRSDKVALQYQPHAVDVGSVELGRHKVLPRERVSISGISGSGKTRLLEALAGLRPSVHPVQVSGHVLVDLTGDQLRRQFALSPQEPMLLVGTIEDNLRIAAPALSELQIQEALEVACLSERVNAAPHGIKTWLGADGGFLSGGERKRLALARAILAQRPWLLLDEPTEGLDADTERQLVSNLQTWLDATRTGLLLVSHRQAPVALTSRTIPIGELNA